jgi:hypothetical protein
MTNLDRWRFFHEGSPSPANWIDLSWYFCVAAALQRKVWMGRLKERPLFPNLYIVLMGPPGLGKSIIVNPAHDLLKYWTYNTDDQTKDDNSTCNRLIETGPDDVTYEKFLECLAGATRRFLYKKEGAEAVYTHASMAIILSDMNSLFKKQADKMAKALLKFYDCEDYTYMTKHQGTNLVKASCVSLLCGATPALLKEAAAYNIFDDGFTSRVIFAFESKPRHERFKLDDLSEQHIAQLPILR